MVASPSITVQGFAVRVVATPRRIEQTDLIEDFRVNHMVAPLPNKTENVRILQIYC